MAVSPRTTGPTNEVICRVIGNSRSIHHDRTSGSDSSLSVSAVGAQSTTTTSHAPEPAWVTRSVSDRISSSPGRSVSSSASMARTPAQSRMSARKPRSSPHCSSSRRRASICWPRSKPSTGVGRSPSGCPSASARECAGSVDTAKRAQAAIGTGQRRGRRSGGLADAALAGEQQHPRTGGHLPGPRPGRRRVGHPSARLLRWWTVLRMRASALRLRKPGMGTTSSMERS